MEREPCSAACTRATLQAATDAYVKAQTAGTSALPDQSSNASYLENDVSMDISKSVLTQSVTIDFGRSLIDTTQCATFTEMSCASNKKPYVIHTRKLFSACGSRTTGIQTVLAKDGDWAFNAAGKLEWSKLETWTPIPDGKRDTYAVIKAGGDALGGGSYTGAATRTTNTCKMPQSPGTLQAGNRQYVVDEELGGGNPNGTPSTNLVRVTVCSEKDCGR
ncbi:hypothetical protein F5882DRAFT_453090 [Hyaloscypha sp. PMI_1271]|nr:hypothetical protein F5882DRAFT_453090 [Hyaloscypha sp. PMI_1271]